MRIVHFAIPCLLLLLASMPACAGSLPLEEKSGITENISDAGPYKFHFELVEILSLSEAVQEQPGVGKSLIPFGTGEVLFTESASRRSFSFLEDKRRLLEIHLFPFHFFW